jgi:hypothetical protein
MAEKILNCFFYWMILTSVYWILTGADWKPESMEIKTGDCFKVTASNTFLKVDCSCDEKKGIDKR